VQGVFTLTRQDTQTEGDVVYSDSHTHTPALSLYLSIYLYKVPAAEYERVDMRQLRVR
jgi:hypothetical protein